MLIPLTNYTKNGFYYQLVERQGDWAIFRQSGKKDSTAPLDVGMAWEVFRIKTSKGGEMTVKNKEGESVTVKFEPKECAPGDNDFGFSAWSCPTLARAREKMAERIAAEHEREEKKK